jgi:hypothetical protein
MVLKKSTVILFGDKSSLEVKESAARIKAGGRKVQFQPTSHPDGTGPCGKVCSCQDTCMNDGAFNGDQGATMGKSF